jgi:hypothetical protein
VRVAAFRSNSRKIVDGERPSIAAMSRTPLTAFARQRDLLTFSKRQIPTRG